MYLPEKQDLISSDNFFKKLTNQYLPFKTSKNEFNDVFQLYLPDFQFRKKAIGKM